MERYDFALLDSFSMLDLYHRGSITANNIAHFLEIHGYNVTSAQLDSIWSRFGTDVNGVISYGEWVTLVLPID